MLSEGTVALRVTYMGSLGSPVRLTGAGVFVVVESLHRHTPDIQ
jgi:hypothetical protein